jgi:hypothetical protein
MTALRRNEPLLKRPKCANSGHSHTVQRTGQFNPKPTFSIGPRTEGMRQEAAFPPATVD